MHEKIKNILLNKQNRVILYTVFFLYLIVISVAWVLTKPYFKEPPCAVCGRADTYPVRTLYQYKIQVIPYVIEKDIYYCTRHTINVPQIVTEIPNPKDTVRKRFWTIVLTTSATLVTFLFILILLEMSFFLLLIHPIFIALIFLTFGIVSNVSMTTFLISTLAIPVLIFIIWNKWIGSQK